MNLPYAATAMIALLAIGDATIDSSGPGLPIDRWLISDAIEPDSSIVNRLEVELLDAPGEVGVLPDRGREAAGTRWSLVRGDADSPAVSLDAPSGSVVYAHVYVRLPEDRTLRVVWGAENCTVGRLWLNGRPTSGRTVPVRFGAGWNTILLKLESGDCRFGFHAALESADAADLEGVRLQASRPPGDVRTGPRPWVIPHDTVVVSPDRRWSDDRLYAGVRVRVTAWGRSAVPGVRVELRGAAEGRAEGQWMTPGVTTEIVVPVRLDRLGRLLETGVVEGRLRWEGGDQATDLVVVGDVDDSSSRIVLGGWDVATVGDDDEERPGDLLPNEAGWSLTGEWKVPAGLEGRRLVLTTDGSPATYSVNGAASSGEEVELCARCAKGAKLVITAQTTGPWKQMPLVLVSAPSGR